MQIKSDNYDDIGNREASVEPIAVGYDPIDAWDEHGAIWEPEPGSRAPDSDERRKMSVAATQDLLKSHLGDWCKKCGKCPPSKENMFQGLPMESDYDKNF